MEDKLPGSKCENNRMLYRYILKPLTVLDKIWTRQTYHIPDSSLGNSTFGNVKRNDQISRSRATSVGSTVNSCEITTRVGYLF